MWWNVRIPVQDYKSLHVVGAAAAAVYVDLCSAIVAKVSNALCMLVLSTAKFQALFEGTKVLLCAKVVGQRVQNHRALHSECSAANSGEPVSWL